MLGRIPLSSLKRLAACILAAALAAAALSGCAPDQPAASSSSSSSSAASSAQSSAASGSSAESDAAAGKAAVTVKGPDDATVLFVGDVAVAGEDFTALDALQATGLDVEVEDAEYGAFVKAIDGAANEGSNGWTYTVNGESPAVSAGDFVVKAGDEVVWTYYVA